MMQGTMDLPESPTVSQPRFDIYAEIHKALRAIMGDTLAKVGSLDSEDEPEVSAVLRQAGDLFRMCRSHLEHEDRFVHAAMEARRAASSRSTAEDHGGHEVAIRNLWLDLETVAGTAGKDRELAVARLYRNLSVFVAENLEHMAREERENNSVLWADYTDAELAELERALIAAVKPEEMTLVLSWMIPALTPQERAHKLAGIRAAVPAPVFEQVLTLARPGLSAAGWSKLQRDLGLPRTA